MTKCFILLDENYAYVFSKNKDLVIPSIFSIPKFSNLINNQKEKYLEDKSMEINSKFKAVKPIIQNLFDVNPVIEFLNLVLEEHYPEVIELNILFLSQITSKTNEKFLMKYNKTSPKLEVICHHPNDLFAKLIDKNSFWLFSLDIESTRLTPIIDNKAKTMVIINSGYSLIRLWLEKALTHQNKLDLGCLGSSVKFQLRYYDYVLENFCKVMTTKERALYRLSNLPILNQVVINTRSLSLENLPN